MHVAELARLYDYGYWANGRLFPVIAQLTEEQFTQDVAGSYGSIRNTLVHVMSAEWGWLDRCGGPARGAKLNPADYPTLESVTETWSKVEGYLRGFLAGLSDEDLDQEIEFSFGGPPERKRLGHLLQHGAFHAIHHRGQLALLLRLLGVTPGNFDLLFYDPVN